MDTTNNRPTVHSCNTVIVGTGAAGYNAACQLWSLGCRDILMVTEHRTWGTSRNTGSDKQTYYKLTLCGGDPDSVREMAQTLFAGQCVDGDIALCEAALSAEGFLHLVGLGVPFPRNRFGEYVGYKTDHDPRCRATSVGPYTSRVMTEKLESDAQDKGIPLLEHTQVIRIVSDGKKVYGLICLDTKRNRLVSIHCKNVIYATGGPGGIYSSSVYPACHFGATGLALEAGVFGKNLTEWQYGLASVNPRWNVSGTYMQVLPRIYSCLPDGSEEREFLNDFFSDRAQMLSMLFLKGYQWPFDVRKVVGGSSIIDILVYLEGCKGRKVYLDYRKNPDWGDFSFSQLIPEAREYLEKAGACFGTPLERLAHMNAPAVSFYMDKGVDLARQPLEIALCAQHNNGGLTIDCWWQTNVEGFFAVGEAAGSHGVYRPGGTALNAGQVGGIRAAQFIAARRQGQPEGQDVLFSQAISEMEQLAGQALSGHGTEDVDALWRQATGQMSLWASAIRDPEKIRECRLRVEQWLRTYASRISARPERLDMVFRLRDLLLCQRAYLAAMEDYLASGGGSRGSALYTDPSGVKPYAALPDAFTFRLDDGSRGHLVQELELAETIRFHWRPARPIPDEDDFFENVWRGYRKNQNID